MKSKFFLFTALFLIPVTAFADPTALGEAASFGELVSMAWSYGAQVIIGLSVFFIVLGAFFYVLSGGSDDRVTTGKKLIWGALAAILIVLFSGVLIRLLHQPAAGTTGALAEVPDVIQNATNILTGIIGAFAALMFVHSGFLYATARGDAGRILKAHRALQYGFFGLGLGLLAYLVVNAAVGYFI